MKFSRVVWIKLSHKATISVPAKAAYFPRLNWRRICFQSHMMRFSSWKAVGLKTYFLPNYHAEYPSVLCLEGLSIEWPTNLAAGFIRVSKKERKRKVVSIVDT